MKPMKSRWTALLPVIGLIILSAGVYIQALRYDFVWDDQRLISAMNATGGGLQGFIGQARSAIGGWNQLTYRPVSLVSFALDAYFWGQNPAGFHLTNLLLHMLVTLLVFRFLTVWTESPRIGWLSAAVFAVHPIHTEAVTWISGRTDLLAGFFSLTALLAVFHSSSAGDSRIKAWGWALIAGTGFALSLMAKETAVIFPVLVILIGVTQKSGSWKTILPSLFITALIAFAYFLSRASVLITVNSGGTVAHDVIRMIHGSRSWSETALFTLSITGEYLRLLLFPVSLKALYSIPPLTVSDPQVIRSVAILSLCLIGLALAMRRSAIAAAATAWILIGLLPTYALFIYTSVSPLAERLLYLPSIGFALLCGMLFSKGIEVFDSSRMRRTALTGIMVGILALYSAGTIHYNYAWADDPHLWENTIRKNPQSSLAHFNLATAYINQQRWDEAIAEYTRAVSIQPVYPEAHYSIGNAYAAQGRRDEAIEQYRIAVRLKPDYTDASINLAVTLHEIGREDLALKVLETAVEINPRDAIAQNNLANVYALQGQWKRAIEHYESALRLQPNYPEAGLNLQRARRMDLIPSGP
jgi:tetratricopeptide (TPR) repeat protein